MLMIKLIVGLGNPGPEYAKTRHNAGFWFIDAIRSGVLNENRRFKGLVGEVQLDNRSVMLLMPMTYMNRSGESVQALAHFYKLKPEEILIVHDELDLPPGRARFKVGGGHGGHNGLRSIITHLGTEQFSRLRIGIGHPGDRREVSNYVLGRASGSEYEAILDSLYFARQSLNDYVSGDRERAMNDLHRR